MKRILTTIMIMMITWAVNAQVQSYYAHKDDYVTSSGPPITTQLRIWLDASQETAYSDGDNVTTANDLQTGYIATDWNSTSNAYPTYEDPSPSGGNSFRFDGVNDYLKTANAVNEDILPGNAHVSIYIVAKHDASPGNDERVLALNNSLGYGLIFRSTSSSVIYQLTIRAGGVATSINKGVTDITNKKVLYCMVDNSAGSFILGDEDNEASDSFLANTWDDFSLEGNAIGSNRTRSSNFFDGEVYEVLIYYDDHNSSERTSIRNYLITKHGI